MHPLANPLTDRRIVLCVAGGIAAYKSVDLLRRLTRAGASVQVAMTKSAQEFVGALTFQALSGQAVFTDLFDTQQDAEIGHVRIADGADLMIVAPATANVLARITAGMANDPVTAAVLAGRAPILLAPAMNVNMWENAATQVNVATLVERGMRFVGPEPGVLACKWTGTGRLSEPADIAEAAARVLCPQDMAGLKVVVSAGGTQEALDPVRFLGNRSTGKMGRALARAAVRRGASVTLVTGPTSLTEDTGATRIAIHSAAQMCEAVCTASAGADLVIMAAAVADYKPTDVANGKLKKEAWGPSPSIALSRTEDILAKLGSERLEASPYLIGFAADTENVEAAARGKLASKGCDMIVANDVSLPDRGFGSEENAVEIVTSAGHQSSLSLASKDAIAHGVLDQALREMGGQKL
ncbi:MAG: bifunctional phosphopantothenoylcysteine decarboxylase/phosphopantothenate--cysteine ligase CoaBC [Myxococcales bacterium]|nr:bifunctional phosphopantothenoylcysteine decarboxylase/phosphopantothenate--cysteine ligase CoaBC [Myxococcales bacterium]